MGCAALPHLRLQFDLGHGRRRAGECWYGWRLDLVGQLARLHSSARRCGHRLGCRGCWGTGALARPRCLAGKHHVLRCILLPHDVRAFRCGTGTGTVLVRWLLGRVGRAALHRWTRTRHCRVRCGARLRMGRAGGLVQPLLFYRTSGGIAVSLLVGAFASRPSTVGSRLTWHLWHFQQLFHGRRFTALTVRREVIGRVARGHVRCHWTLCRLGCRHFHGHIGRRSAGEE